MPTSLTQRPNGALWSDRHPPRGSLAAKVPEGDGWLHELKHDDYRRACAPGVAKRA
jgi:hypothetical protein